MTDDLLDRLSALPAVAFEELVHRLGIRAGVLAPQTAPQMQRAIDLLRHGAGDAAFHRNIEQFLDRITPSVRAVLRLSSEAGGGEVTLTLGDSIVLGRGYDTEVRLDHGAVSKRHALVRLGADGLVVEDLRSKNHVYVNGIEVIRAPLKMGDRLLLGRHGPQIDVTEAPPPVASTAVESTADPTLREAMEEDTTMQ